MSNETIIKIVTDDNGNQCRILLSADAQSGSRKDQQVARQLVGIAKNLMNPATSNKLRQLMSNAGAINQLKSMFGM